MKRTIAAVSSLALAAPLVLTAPAGAGPAPAADRVVEIGTPLQDVLLIGGVVAPGPDGRTVLWSASSGEPAHLSAVDPTTGDVLARYPLSGAGGSWAVTAAPDGSVYVGTYGSAKLFRWTEDTGLTDLGTPVDAGFVWDVATDDDSVVYGGTSPGGTLFSYDPATGEYRDYGRLDPERSYVRSVDTHGDTVYAGTENPARVYAVDTDTGERQALPVPPDLANHEEAWAYDVDVVGDHLYVRFGEAFPSPLYVWDIAEGQWVDRIDDAHGLEPSPADENGHVYLIRANELVRYDPATGEVTGTGVPFTGRVANTRGIGWAELDDPDHPGKTLVGLLWRGTMFRYNPTTGASSFVPTDIQGEPIDITAISEGPDGRVYTGGFLNGGFAAIDPGSAEIEEFHTFSQSEGMLNHDGRLYVGAYPDARLYSYDPALPWHSPEYSPHPEPGHDDNNPERLFDLKADRQIRPRALTSAGDLVAVGTMAILGELSGVLAVYDPATGELVTRERGVVTDQGITSLAYQDGILYGGTTIYSGHSATPPTQTEAKVFAWSVAENRKLWEFVPAPGKPAIPALTFAADGRLWGTAGQDVFAIDVAAAEVVDRHSYGPSDSSSGSLTFNPADGLLYGSLAGDALFTLDPEDGTRTVLHDTQIGHLAVHSSGDVYFSTGSTLFRYDAPFCATSGTTPDTRPHVVVGDIDSGVSNHQVGADCTVNDLILDDRTWPNHGRFVHHVRSVTSQLVAEETIEKWEAQRIVRAAARSDIGR
ncbi:outer membrane protein assembly factor BamB family protein [Actinophytocola gossypii]|uniref:PQQ-binding-like beta-propeller repeat protein n=1 Tax=Actinophytocola gossypii TaxID=2812003 RepID=A0ABT2J5F4_9PSEU|nr:PQQ-binding-like beta-propeller repeat protein [Actinophytocola gossypii]MCT2583092.1 PQQ-binding-like beta-propeller repeat protein [Actinophytocola gossypii]